MIYNLHNHTHHPDQSIGSCPYFGNKVPETVSLRGILPISVKTNFESSGTAELAFLGEVAG